MGYRTVTGFAREVKKTLSPDALDAMSNTPHCSYTVRTISIA